MLMKMRLVVLIAFACFIALCPAAENSQDIMQQLDAFTSRYYTNPEPNKAALLLWQFLDSEYFADEEMSSPLYTERLNYFFARVALLEPKVLTDYLSIFEQGNHEQRSFMIDVLAIGGDERIVEYFESKLRAGRFINEREQIEWYLFEGIPIDFDILNKDVNQPTYMDYLLAEFMVGGNELAITKIIGFITEPNVLQVEPNDLELYIEYSETLLTRYGKKDDKILRICKARMTDSSGTKRQILEDIVDRIDGSVSMARLISQAKNEKSVPGAKAWALGASAVLVEHNHGRHNFLSVDPISKNSIKREREMLSEWWGIESREGLLNDLEWLMDEGHRDDFQRWGAYLKTLNNEQYQKVLQEYEGDNGKLQEIRIARAYYEKLGSKGILGWDMSRYICLCRWGYLVGYISEEEAWQKIMPVARGLQKAFDSWEDLGRNYLIGRKFWSYKHTKDRKDALEDAYQRLVDMKSSPWNLYPWDMDLGDANQIKDSDFTVMSANDSNTVR